MDSFSDGVENGLLEHLHPWLVDELMRMIEQNRLNFQVTFENKDNGSLKAVVTRPGGDSNALDDATRGVESEGHAKHARESRLVVVSRADVTLGMGSGENGVFDSVVTSVLSESARMLGVVAGDLVEDNGAPSGRGVVVRVQGPPSRICEVSTGEDGTLTMTCECPLPVRFRFLCPHQMCTLLEMKRNVQLGDSTAGFVSAILGLVHKRWRLEHESPATGVGGGGGAGAAASGAQTARSFGATSFVHNAEFTSNAQIIEVIHSKHQTRNPLAMANSKELSSILKAAVELVGGMQAIQPGSGTGSHSGRKSNGPEKRKIPAGLWGEKPPKKK